MSDLQAQLVEMMSGTWEDLHPALRAWVHETKIGLMIRHPFCYTPIGPNGEMSETANRFYKQKISCRREYLNERDWLSYLSAWERPYRMTALTKLWHRSRISLDELRELLAFAWVDTEMPQVNQSDPLQLFREAGFTTDNPQEWERISKLPELQLYRGVDYEFELTADGPSWTFDLQVAKFFAYRGGSKGDVFSYVAHPSEALAYFGGRDESEIILDFANAGDSEQIVRLTKKQIREPIS